MSVQSKLDQGLESLDRYMGNLKDGNDPGLPPVVEQSLPAVESVEPEAEELVPCLGDYMAAVTSEPEPIQSEVDDADESVDEIQTGEVEEPVEEEACDEVEGEPAGDEPVADEDADDDSNEGPSLLSDFEAMLNDMEANDE